MNIEVFDEQFITRESICGHFRPSGLAWGGIWDRFLRKMLEACFSPKIENRKIDFRGTNKKHGPSGWRGSVRLVKSL